MINAAPRSEKFGRRPRRNYAATRHRLVVANDRHKTRRECFVSPQFCAFFPFTRPTLSMSWRGTADAAPGPLPNRSKSNFRPKKHPANGSKKRGPETGREQWNSTESFFNQRRNNILVIESLARFPIIVEQTDGEALIQPIGFPKLT